MDARWYIAREGREVTKGRHAHRRRRKPPLAASAWREYLATVTAITRPGAR